MLICFDVRNRRLREMKNWNKKKKKKKLERMRLMKRKVAG